MTVVPSRWPPASSGHPATPSDTLLPNAGCTLQSQAGAGRRGQPRSEPQSRQAPTRAPQTLEMRQEVVLSLTLPRGNRSCATAREELFKVIQGVPLTAGR